MTHRHGNSSEAEPVRFGQAIELAENKLRQSDPNTRAEASGAQFQNGRFTLAYFGQQAEITLPECRCTVNGQESRGVHKVLLLHYLLDCINVEPSGNWISFREIKNSNSYLGAFLSRSPGAIAACFDNREQDFKAAVARLDGIPAPDLPGLAFIVRAFPRLPLGVILHPGEPGLPTQAQVLFDRTSTVFWPAEDLAVTGEVAAQFLTEI